VKNQNTVFAFNNKLVKKH